MSWEAVTAVGTVFTAFAIVVTAVAGVDQLRQLRAQRRDAAAVDLLRSLQDESFARALRLILKASDSDPHYGEAVLLVGFRLEMLGALVHKQTVPFEIAEELIGGPVVICWRNLKTSTIEDRNAQGWPAHFEWFQWLAEQFEKHGRFEKTPAHVRLKDWSPS